MTDAKRPIPASQIALRSALVTGGSSGIGLAIARVLAEEGHNLTLAARGRERLHAAAAELAAQGVVVEPVAADVANPAAVAALVEGHCRRNGAIDVLVNAAGVAIAEPVETMGVEALDLQLAVNLRACMLTTREAVPGLGMAVAARGRGLIVNVSSDAGKRGFAEYGAYSASKFGVVGFSQSAREELAPQGIQVTALCPGFVDTPMTERFRDEVPPEEMMRPRDLAEAVRFLLRLSPHCGVPEILLKSPHDG